MGRMNLRRIDLNLLTVFEVVYEERNQRKAAERLFLTQPAVSAALSRLKDITQDKLFQSTPRGLIPTARAEELYTGIHGALDMIRDDLGASEEFRPERCQRIFKVAVEYGSGVALALPFFRALREEVPQGKLQIQSINDEAMALEMLKKGELDVLISQRRREEAGIESALFNLHQGVLLVRENHPRITSEPDFETLLKEEFVLVHGQPMSYENQDLDALTHGIKDQVVLEVPSAVIIPQIVKQTDLVSIISLQTLRALDARAGLQVFDLPVNGARANAYVHWNLNTDPTSLWFRAFTLHQMQKIQALEQESVSGSDDRQI